MHIRTDCERVAGISPYDYQGGDGYRGQTQGKDAEEGLEGGAQQATGSGDELKGGKRLRGGQKGSSSRKQPKGAETPGRLGECTGTEVAGVRVKGKKVGKKQSRIAFAEIVK